MLQKLGKFIVNARFWFLGIFFAFALVSLIAMQYVGANYNLVHYLPDNSKTKISIMVMDDEFGSSGSASIMISGVNADEAQHLVNAIKDVEGVTTAVFDATDESFYNSSEKKALVKLFLADSDYSKEAEATLNEVKELLKNESYAMSGGAVTAINNRTSAEGEMAIILIIAIVIVLTILFLTSLSYIEPVIFLIVIGVAILINMGTNIFLGEISFITKSISSVMLIALEMDYSIVLLHRYREEKEKRGDSKIAMQKAIAGSFTAVVASSFTVMAGLISLMFMDFSIGFDIGMVLAKGVFISVLAVIFFMPAIILMFDKLIEKTTHKSFLPNMKKIGSFAQKTKYIMPAIFLCLVVFAITLQGSISFSYNVETAKEGSETYIAEKQVEQYFGKQNPLVIMVNKDDLDKQKQVYNYVVNYKNKSGEAIINSANVLAVSSAYDLVNYNTLKNMNLSNSTIFALYDSLGKDASVDSIYQIDVINYLVENDGVLLADLTSEINENYNQLNEPISQQLAKEKYNLSDNDILQLYQGNESVTIYALSNYACENNLLDNMQSMDATKLLILNSVANEELTAEDIIQSYGLSSTQIAYLFNVLGKDATVDTLVVYELINLLKNNPQIIEEVVNEKQITMANAVQQFNSVKTLLVGKNYSRLIFNINASSVDEDALKFMSDLEIKLNEICNDDYYIVCNSYNVIGMADVFSHDRAKTDLITVWGILLIVLLAFKSISVPVLLVFVIQGAIWINLGITVLSNSAVFFVCYLLAMAIQMGATIDYGILLTDRYIFARRKLNKYDAIKMAIDKSFVTVITSGSILVLATLIIHFVSSIPIISDIGMLIGLGAFISIITILFVLPQSLLLLDKVIEKTTIGAKFLPNNESGANDEKLLNKANDSDINIE